MYISVCIHILQDYKMNLVYYTECFFPVFILFVLIIIYNLKNCLIVLPPPFTHTHTHLQPAALPKVMSHID